MTPVLATRDPGAAKRMLRDVFGFREIAPDRLQLGDQDIVLCDTAALPADLLTLPFDHLALSVADADHALAHLAARGAVLDPDFTPDGPVEIPEFWSNGVRFVFLRGPGGAPLEFCQKLGAETGSGHSHYGLRTPMLDQTEDRLRAYGARRVARHLLAGPPPVEVRFMTRGGEVFELFDQPPRGAVDPNTGWVGFVDAA